MGHHSEVARQRIRERAYLLWWAADCPSGKAEHFWLLAEQETKSEEQSYDRAR
jgi:hypothetical protein